MSKKKDIVRRAAPVPRIREQSTLMQTHESFADLINGHYPSQTFLDVLGFNYLRSYGARLQDDFFYSDDDDDDSDDDDDDDDYFYPSRAAYSPLDPHPRIRQLTDEEADRHAKELIAEEERRKGKTERNKRKKMRKKERKRLEKENAIKENLPEKDQETTESSENQEENPIIVTNVDELSNTQNVAQAVGGDEGGSISKEETVVKPNKKDVEPKETDINNSYDSTPKLVPEETFNQKPAKERKKEKSQLVEIQQPKEEKPKTTENVDVEKKNETKKEEKTLDPTNEECAKRSRELAAAGNRFAASGQYEIAVKCFTDAIKFNPKEFKLFGNRSLCYERMQQYENALRDADLTLCMEPGWTKGLFRKGKALCGLKKYYEASLVYTEVLKLDSSSAEAKQELKRAQTLHLMEMGFSREESLEALKTHATLEHAVEALFSNSSPAAASNAHAEPPVEQEEDDIEGEWIVQQASRSRAQQVKEFEALSQSRSKSQSPTPPPPPPPPPLSRSSLKADLISIWVGSLAPSVTYAHLHELFSRVGVVYSIKMLLEHQCAFVNYTRKEDCDRAIQSFNGMVFEGSPLSVRYPSKTHTALSYKKECFFWRTTGCTRQDCTYKHVPEHKNIDRDKFTSRLGRFNV